MSTKKTPKVNALGGETPTNGAEAIIVQGQPYLVNARIRGCADILFHRWNCEAVEEKAKAAKGSKAKKSDDLESYVYRNDNNELCIPGEYFRQSIIHASKFRQDPRSPRKSAADLFRAAVCSLSHLCSLGKPTWDYVDQRRVTVQRAGITRARPAVKSGWQCELQLMVLLPEYVSPEILHEVLTNAGRLIGIAELRPTYGRFQIDSFDIGFDS